MTTNNAGRGGRRVGSGRPAGTGKSGEPTKVIRIPESVEPTILDFLEAYKARKQAASPVYPDDVQFPVIDAQSFDVPLYAYAVPAGSPMPAEDAVEQRLDLNQFLIRNPTATFYFRVKGDSMNRAGILDGAIAAVDCSKLPRNHEPVLAVVNGEFTVKRYVKTKSSFELHPDSDNPKHKPIVPGRTDVLEVRGVIVGTVQKFG